MDKHRYLGSLCALNKDIADAKRHHIEMLCAKAKRHQSPKDVCKLDAREQEIRNMLVALEEKINAVIK